MKYRENDGRFRQRRLRRRRKLKNAAFVAEREINNREEPAAPVPPSDPPAPPGPASALKWPERFADDLSRPEIRAMLDNLGVEYDGRSSTERLRSLLTGATSTADGNGG